MKHASVSALTLALLGIVLLCPERAIAQQELFKLTASDGETDDRFGQGVGISGNLAIVGAYQDDDLGGRSGSAYLFDVRTGQELLKLTAADGAAEDWFGESVSISGSRAIVGAQGDDDNGFQSGSAYVFDVATGQQLLKLTASDGNVAHRFGWSVAISGDRAVVGANEADGLVSLAGAAYVFDVTTGQELFKLIASDGALQDYFGHSVGISGSRVVVGARQDDDLGDGSGSAYVFDVASGQQLFKLTASDGASGDWFGHSAAISGHRAVVGALFYGSWSGSAYVFDVTTGQQLYKLTASDAAWGDLFGASVAISSQHVVVGAKQHNNEIGATFVFDARTGHELSEHAASDGVSGDLLGWSIALSGGRFIAGAPRDDGLGIDSGSAYIFDIPYKAFCFGDGSDGICPCGNTGGTGEGCGNSGGVGGLLQVEGSGSVAADDLIFLALNLLPAQPALLFVGLNAINGGNGVVFGDGLRCAGGSVVRLGFSSPDANGDASWGPGLNSSGGWTPGDKRYFQVWYRDPGANSPCGMFFNLTNGLEVIFAR